jgi:deoxyribodipyrimidine photo-lyase
VSVGIAWFRKDLRLTDNPAWSAATRRHSTVVPLFVIDPKLWDRCSDSRVALLAANLRSLDARLTEEGGRLRVEIGTPDEVVPRTATETGAQDVTINSDVTPYARRRDEAVARRIPLDSYQGSLVHPPGSILTQ